MVKLNQGVIWGSLEGRNELEFSRNASVQPVDLFSSWLLRDCTFVYVAVKAAVSLWWNASVLRACESGSVFASLSLLCDFVLLKMAGKIKDHATFLLLFFIFFPLQPFYRSLSLISVPSS